MSGARPRIYLDYNASAPVFPEVAAAMAVALHLANPSSIHAEGRAARAAVERARRQVAELAGADANSVVFTSGGSEAANAALRGMSDGGVPPGRLLLAGIEHPCVLTGHGFPGERLTMLPVDSDGILDLDALEQALQAADMQGERVFLALQLANNETGVIQPLREASDLVHRFGGLVLADAVQAAGRIALSLPMLGADAIVLSAHKIGGPKGVGAIVFASERLRLAEALVNGGGQEKGQRSGTENVAGIVGFGIAAGLAREKLPMMRDIAALRDRLEREARALAPALTIFGLNAPRLPNTTAFSLPGLRAETALIAFDLDGIALSSGSACSSGKVRGSAVLKAMSVDDALAEAALRVSLGWGSTDAHIDSFLVAFARRAETARMKLESKAA